MRPRPLLREELVAILINESRSEHRRPSRRNDIVIAAIRVFARQGYADASIQEVAAEAGVAPTAVYYHFSGKEDLFDVALGRILETITTVVRSTRGDTDPADADSLREVIFAVWDWLDEHPDECQLLHYHLPGATPRARLMQQQFEEIHLQRAFDYVIPDSDAPLAGATVGRESPIARHANAALAVRTLLNLTLLIHPLRTPDGPFRTIPQRALREALSEVSVRLVMRD
jgi:AcrR family transcriptional regulator